MPLEDYYVGDEAFYRFASAPDPELDAAVQAWDGREALTALCLGDGLLARQVFRMTGDAALAYFDDRPPVLEGLSPRECMQTLRGQERLKEALLRFPYI
jgi:hypothetical protein